MAKRNDSVVDNAAELRNGSGSADVVPALYDEFDAIPSVAPDKTKTKIAVLSKSGREGTCTVPGEPAADDLTLALHLGNAPAVPLAYKCGKFYKAGDKAKQTGSVTKVVRGADVVPFIASERAPAV